MYTSIIVPGAILLPLIIAIIRKGYWGTPEKVVFVYLLTSGLFNVLAVLLAARHINNLPFLHLYTVLEFLLITGFFYVSTNGKTERLLIRSLWILFPVIAIIAIHIKLTCCNIILRINTGK